jgi:flagellar FliJ protein
MAKKFKFRPEVLLKLRQQRELLAKRRVAEIQQRVGQIQEAMTRLRNQLSEQDAMVRQGVLVGAVDVGYMSLYRRHVMTLHKAIIAQAQQLREVAGELQLRRAELTEALKQRKVLSKLKDKQQHKHRLVIEKDEARQIDEMSSARFGHQHALEVTA